MNVASNNLAASRAEGPLISAKPSFLGFGLGLRHQHYDEILSGNPPIDWFEIISENYMVPGGQPLQTLEKIRARYPLGWKGVPFWSPPPRPPTFEFRKGWKTSPHRSNRSGVWALLAC